MFPRLFPHGISWSFFLVKYLLKKMCGWSQLVGSFFTSQSSIKHTIYCTVSLGSNPTPSPYHTISLHSSLLFLVYNTIPLFTTHVSGFKSLLKICENSNCEVQMYQKVITSAYVVKSVNERRYA